MATPSGALAGIRVVDLATARGELAGRVLADLGAEVIAVEPRDGAAARRRAPFANGSLYWAAVALGKRSVVLDLEDPADRERLRRLVSTADVLIESFDPGTLDALDLGYGDLASLNPALVYVSITPYGLDGPQAAAPASDLTLEAAGGLLGLQGDRDRPPIPVGFPQAYLHAGVQAAADTVIALHERLRSGRGQQLDVSTQAAVVWTLMNATGYPPNTGGNAPGSAEERAEPPPQLFPGLTLPRLWECHDGYVQFNVGLPGIGGRTFHALMRWAETEGALPEELRGLDWQRWTAAVRKGERDVEQVSRALEALRPFLAQRTKAELQAFSNEQRIVLAPIYDVADLLADRQLAAREFWTQLGGHTHPGPFARLSRTPIALRSPAPALGEAQSLLETPQRTLPLPTPTAAPRESAFAGLKVADFAWVGVGPMISKALADHGACVVHVESSTRVDVLRRLPPFKDGEPGLDRSQFMANFNTSKLGVTFDLATDGGLALAQRLVDWADVVVESFTPGTMRKFGLDYETLSHERPDLVMLSTCLRGQTGPEAGYAGFGGQGAALAGFHSITGWPDRQPWGPWGAYTDFINPRFGVAALAAALVHRHATGEGQYIDLSQTEAGIRFLEPLVLDYTENGRVAGPIGHDSPYACPHGVFAAAGRERYVALAVETAAQWQALRSVAPLDEFDDPSLDALEARAARAPAIHASLERWLRPQEPFALSERLQRAGVPASVVHYAADLYKDPQLTHRGFFVTLDHREMGPTPNDGLVTRFSETPGRLRNAAPCLGQDTEHVLRDLLHLTDDQITAYATSGALT